MRALRAGDRLGDCEVVTKLRTGGMATLYLGRRVGPDGFSRYVAIKVLRDDFLHRTELAEMFLHEARLSSQIDHPNVVRIEQLGDMDGRRVLVMEYVSGCSLAELWDELAQRGRRMSKELAVHIAIMIADGLHAAHGAEDASGQRLGIVHRDVSPDNVLVAFKGYVKVIDFGIAKARLDGNDTRTGVIRGKVRYMSPEQAMARTVDARTDIYALGVILWELLTGRRLFSEDIADYDLLKTVRNPTFLRPRDVVPDLDPVLDEVVMAALARRPEDRPETARKLRQMLAAAVPESLTIDAPRVSGLMAEIMGGRMDAALQDLPAELRADHPALAPNPPSKQLLAALTREISNPSFAGRERHTVGKAVGGDALGESSSRGSADGSRAGPQSARRGAANAIAAEGPSGPPSDGPTKITHLPAETGGADSSPGDPSPHGGTEALPAPWAQAQPSVPSTSDDGPTRATQNPSRGASVGPTVGGPTVGGHARRGDAAPAAAAPPPAAAPQAGAAVQRPAAPPKANPPRTGAADPARRDRDSVAQGPVGRAASAEPPTTIHIPLPGRMPTPVDPLDDEPPTRISAAPRAGPPLRTHGRWADDSPTPLAQPAVRRPLAGIPNGVGDATGANAPPQAEPSALRWPGTDGPNLELARAQTVALPGLPGRFDRRHLIAISVLTGIFGAVVAAVIGAALAFDAVRHAAGAGAARDADGAGSEATNAESPPPAPSAGIAADPPGVPGVATVAADVAQPEPVPTTAISPAGDSDRAPTTTAGNPDLAGSADLDRAPPPSPAQDAPGRRGRRDRQTNRSTTGTDERAAVRRPSPPRQGGQRDPSVMAPIFVEDDF